MIIFGALIEYFTVNEICFRDKTVLLLGQIGIDKFYNFPDNFIFKFVRKAAIKRRIKAEKYDKADTKRYD